jgi:predicted nuclease with TOPRIM domain
MIPAYLDDRERVRGRLETVEADNERLRIELADSRRELSELRADVEAHRAERARVAESFHAIVEHLTALQGPVNDVSSRLHVIHPVAAEMKV